MGKTTGHISVKLHLFQRLLNQGPELSTGFGKFMNLQPFSNDLLNSQSWRQRREGILEHDLQFPAQGTHLPVVKLREQDIFVIIVKMDGPCEFIELEQTHGKGGLA